MTKRMALMLVLLMTGVAQAQKQPITHEALWQMKRVGAPALSPDGTWAVFSVLEPAYKSADNVSDLWIVRTDGSGAPRRLTNTKAGESGVAWSPDGTRIAFVARREGDDAAQIYLLDVTQPGEAVRLTSLSTGARSPRWSPDGKTMLFTSSVYPGTSSDSANRRIAKERKDRAYNVRIYDSFPVRNFDHWLAETQAHLFVQPAEPGAAARDLLGGTQLVANAGFRGGSEEDFSAAWSRDGSEIVFAATTQQHTTAYAEAPVQLYRIAAAGGEPVRITNDGASYSDLTFSHDGKKLYALRDEGGEVTYSHSRLTSFDWPNVGAPNVLTASWDNSISDYDLAPNGRSVFLTVSQAGRSRIYVMSWGADPILITKQPVGSFSGVSVGGSTRANPVIVAQWQSATSPPEITRVDVQTGTPRELTNFTAAADSLDLAPLREFWFTAQNGRRIHSFLLTPPNFDANRKYPLFVVMHGGPHSAWNDEWGLRWNYHLLAKPGYVLVLTNYTGSTGFGEEFARAIKGDPLRGPANEINEAADEAIRLFPFIDASKQVAGGASYGGHLAYWMEASTTRYRALVAHAGAINPESQWGTSDVIWHREVMFGGPIWEQGNVWKEQNAARYATAFKTPILLTVGERDFRVPLNNTLEAWSLMQRMKVPSRLLVFPDQNHWIMSGEDSRFWFSEVAAWLGRYLNGN